MGDDVLFNRREFMGMGALGALGTVAEHSAPKPLIPAMQPALVAQDPPARPPAPEVVNFTADDPSKRGPTFIALRWGAAERAERYEIRLSRPGAEVVRQSPTNEVVFDGLQPNQDYNVSVRAMNSAGASEWSPVLSTCTRPARPSAPKQGYNEMTEVGTDMLLLWDLSSDAVPAGATVRLDKRREGEAVRILNQTPSVQGNFVDVGYAASDLYAISLAVANPRAPRGVNLSARSEEIMPLRMTFAELRLPGEHEVRHISLSYLRDYYG